LTLALPRLVRLARETFGEPLDIVAAAGLGRSFGLRSSVPNPRLRLRSLPGILDSGLFEHLEALPFAPTRALVTDVGNDVAYGVAVDRLVAWVDACVGRLLACGAEVTLTGLPVDSLRRLSPVRFALFRALFVPSCRLALPELVARAAAVSAQLEALAARRGARFVALRSDWYGLDPIHVRRHWRHAAWREILLGDAAAEASPPLRAADHLGARRVWLGAPARRWLCGVERRHAQPAIATAGGTRISLY
jgi:hypothetical protein